MFDNIGNKIKILAEVICWIGIIGSIILGIVMMEFDESLIIAGLLVVPIGFLVSWISSFLLYGFGQLIENTDRLVLKAEYFEEDWSEPEAVMPIEQEPEPEAVTPVEQEPKDFLTEIKETETADLKVILQDQRDLYTEEELSIIEKELAARGDGKVLLHSKPLTTDKKQ